MDITRVAELFLPFIGSTCAAILFNVSIKKIFWAGLSGMLGWAVFAYLSGATGNVELSTFIGAVAVGLYSESAARIVRSPATVFSIPGIFPLVPGVAAYNTVQDIVDNKLIEAAGKAIETMTSAGAIAFGIMLVTAAFRLISKVRER